MTALEMVQKYCLGIITLGELTQLANDHDASATEIDDAVDTIGAQKREQESSLNEDFLDEDSL